MVALHSMLLVGAATEVMVADRPFVPALGWPMLGLVVAAQVLRWWCIRTLGRRWSTRVVVVPGLPLVDTGPYRVLRHPNYLAVVVEGIALPLVHSAWVTAAVFTALNLALLRVRVRVEETALTGGLAT
jgi:methyltransferase